MNQENKMMNPFMGAPLMGPGMMFGNNGMMVKTMRTEATLYVGNLNPSLMDSRLFEFFRPYGEIVNCKIMRDIYSGESRGFAFVSY